MPEGYILLTTPSSPRPFLFLCDESGERVDFAMGFAVQLVIELVESGNREDAHGKLSIGFRL